MKTKSNKHQPSAVKLHLQRRSTSSPVPPSASLPIPLRFSVSSLCSLGKAEPNKAGWNGAVPKQQPSAGNTRARSPGAGGAGRWHQALCHAVPCCGHRGCGSAHTERLSATRPSPTNYRSSILTIWGISMLGKQIRNSIPELFLNAVINLRVLSHKTNSA